MRHHLGRRTRTMALGAGIAVAAALSACNGGRGASGDGIAKACDAASFARLDLAGATVASVTAVAAGSYTPAGSTTALADLPAFCRIDANATPSSDSSINFQVWVPQGARWNGKFVATGNGGYSPQLSYGDMAHALRQGYAVAGGDTGHTTEDMAWGQGHPEKIIDWGTRSIHAITEPAKRLVAALQGSRARRAYYYGCSTGGHQGYAEIQRYPQDFDGVIAGAPGNNRTRLNVEFMHRFLSNRQPDTNSPVILSAAKAAGITAAAVKACDALDGVRDGVIEDPRACTSAVFDVASLQCTGGSGDAASCLTPDELAVARKIYAGPRNPRTGAQLYPGLVVGTEAGWSGYWGSTKPVRADYWRLWTFDDPQWNWWTFDYDSAVQLADERVGPLVDQVNPDIAAFKARGGKAIVYQGWADPVVNAADTIGYYEQVRSRQGSQAATDDFFRLFLVPGMGHCSGGSGTANFGNQGGTSPVVSADRDVLMALDRWVEQGSAPERIVASRVEGGNAVRTRPLCPYPKKAVYSGSGSTDDAANFACR
ncbi:tannase/feruloyl esterase family alpha/beta hydrolase [Xylophilus sp.]|uniref:tannase/feruloyl esterase family alpha/beta hydrolase n=1 Tax=Xylophilus sp. TaxID=2653893 RepID=UPI0013BAD53A|nr:tannase/feruloyl esterase family alpha/beta hydrolase [Xylophilus sp.]KAF1046317.1 MAG: Mono(2-hydroxyethyl) terephthalate hydrolase [Xylophilus sp.]